MTKTVEFIFDFASPNAYLAYRAMVPMLARAGARLDIVPCLLGGIFKATGNQPPMVAFANVKGKREYMAAETRRFVKKHGLEKFKMNPHFPVTTLLLGRGALVAEADGELTRYVEAGLRHMWEDGLKMDEPEVFAKAMAGAGFDGKALLAATQRPEIKERLIANTEAAVARGVFGIPTFFVGQEMFFGKESVPLVSEELGNH